ncbi:MAG: hypothetical protein Q8P18_05020 [Pseudomonadota bacterium]|nr:hypothetical protein [Pseudomonadota bacterium]
MKRLTLILLALPLALPAIALAQEEDAAPRKILYQKATEIDFNAVNVDAALIGPSGGFHSESKRPIFIPMISVRSNFNPEMEASIDDVK